MCNGYKKFINSHFLNQSINQSGPCIVLFSNSRSGQVPLFAKKNPICLCDRRLALPLLMPVPGCVFLSLCSIVGNFILRNNGSIVIYSHLYGFILISYRYLYCPRNEVILNRKVRTKNFCATTMSFLILIGSSF